MSDRFTIRLPSNDKSFGVEELKALAESQGMTTSQWVRALVVKELKALGHLTEKPKNAELREYAEAISDEKRRETFREFAKGHNSAKESHLRPKAPKRPSAMRMRIRLSAEELIALEDVGNKYFMDAHEVASTIIRKWIGVDRRAPPTMFVGLNALRTEIRRIGVNVHQVAAAANKYAANPNYSRAEKLEAELKALPQYMAQMEMALKTINDLMGLDTKVWFSGALQSGEGLDVLNHPSVAPEYIEDEAP